MDRYQQLKKHLNASNVMLALVTLALLAASFHRLFYGVEITDEAYYVAEARLVAQGAIPFVNNWTQSPGHVLLFFWLVPLFEWLSGGTEGVFLFMRIAFGLFRLLSLGIVFLILRKQIRPQILLLFLLPFVPFSPFNVNMFSYNSLLFLLLLIGQALFIRLLLCDECPQKKRVFSIGAGLVMALACLAHPSNLLLAIVFAAMLTLFSIYKRKPLTPVLLFALAGLAFAAIMVAALSIAGGGFTRLLNGVRALIVDNPYFYLSKRPIPVTIASLKGVIKQHFWIMLFSAVMFCFGACSRLYSRRRGRAFPHEKEIKRVAIWTFLIVVAAYVIKLVLQYAPTNRGAYTSAESAIFAVPFALLPFLPAHHKKSGAALILAIWVPCIISLIAVAVSNWNGIAARYYLLYSGAMLSIPFFAMALDNAPTETKKGASAARALGVFGLTCALLCNAYIQPYMYFYREASYAELNYRVQSGVYKGIHTTKERGEALIALESELRTITNDEDDVLFMEVVPMAYLMTDASFCAPTSWDIMLYSYGFKGDKIMHEYFQAVNRYPNKIIYIHTGRDKVLSIDTDDYQFNDFVHANYHLVYERTMQPFPIKMFEKR